MTAPTNTDELEAQAQALLLIRFNEDEALQVGLYMLEQARAHRLVIAFEVWLQGRLIVRVAMPGTDSTNDDYIGGKRRLVERFERSSLYARWRYEEAGTTFEAETGLTFPEYAPHGGAVPVQLVDGTQAGIVIVSGLEQREDHALVVRALHQIGEHQRSEE